MLHFQTADIIYNEVMCEIKILSGSKIADILCELW